MRKTDNAGAAKHESFTPEEEDLIIKMHAAMGSRLCYIYLELLKIDLTDSDDLFFCLDLDGHLLHNIYQERQKKK